MEEWQHTSVSVEMFAQHFIFKRGISRDFLTINENKTSKEHVSLTKQDVPSQKSGNFLQYL